MIVRNDPNALIREALENLPEYPFLVPFEEWRDAFLVKYPADGTSAISRIVRNGMARSRFTRDEAGTMTLLYGKKEVKNGSKN